MINLSLIGYGNIAKSHIETFNSLGAKVVASCNRSKKNRILAKTESGINKTYSSIRKMLENELCDGIICCVSYDQIYSVAKQIIPYKIPILLEKPPGTSYNEFRELYNLCNKYKTPVMIGLNRRYYSVINNAIKHMGGMNKIKSIDIFWSEDPEKWFSRGMTYDQVRKLIYANSIHGIDLMCYLSQEKDFNNVDVQVEIISKDKCKWIIGFCFKNKNGKIINYKSTWGIPGGWRLELCSSNNRYVFEPLEKCSMYDKKLDISSEKYDQKYKPGFIEQSEAFLSICKHKDETYSRSTITDIDSTMKLLSKLEKQIDYEINNKYKIS